MNYLFPTAVAMLRNDLIQRFESFVEQTRSLMAVAENERERAEKALEKEYRQIQGLFSKLSDREARACMPKVNDEGARALMEHLIFGREQVRNVQRPIARLIEKDPARTDWAISQFMTTHAAFEMIQNGRKKKSQAEEIELDERSRLLLAGMLGVEGYELSGEFAKKVRGELLASTLAYAHSHLCKRDVAEWEDNEEVRDRYEGNIETYLCDCITHANRPLFYSIQQRADGSWDLACTFQETGDNPVNADHLKDGLGSTAVKLQADCFCVNHEEKVFIVGAATTQTSFDAKQMEALVRHVKALEMLAENDPRYKGYKVRPFFFHSGYFSACTDAEAESSTGQAFVRDVRADGMSQKHLEALARMAFFNLMAEKHPHPEAGRIFALINPHVAGCNTLEQYYQSEMARNQPGQGRKAAQKILADLALAAEALADESFDVRKSGPRETLVHGVIHAVSNFYTLYPLEPGQALPAREAKLMLRIGESFEGLREKIEAANSFANAGAQLVPMSFMLVNQKSVERYAQQVSRVSDNKGVYHWGKELYATLTKRKGVDILDVDFLRENAANFLAPLKDGILPPLLVRVTQYLHNHPNVVMTPNSQNLWNLAIGEIQSLAEAARKGYRLNPKDCDGDMKNNESFVQSMRNAAKAETLAGNDFLSTTFRMFGSLFQMDYRALAGETRSVAFGKNAPAFIEACLESGDEELRVLALETLSGTPNAELPTMAKRKGMRR